MSKLIPLIVAAFVALPALASPVTQPAGYASLDQYKTPVAQPQGEVRRFAAPRGASVRETLDRWAASVGWKPVLWALPAETDFTLGAASHFDGDVGLATRSLVKALGAEANLAVSIDEPKRTITITPAQ